MKHIYGLIDPNINKIRYVGQTDDLTKRLQQHMQDGSNTSKVEWLKSLKTNGQQPRIIVLSEVQDGDNAHEIEYRWIYFGRQNGWPLTNTTAMKTMEYYSLQGYFERLIVEMEKPEGVSEQNRTWADIKQLIINRFYGALAAPPKLMIGFRNLLSHPSLATTLWVLLVTKLYRYESLGEMGVLFVILLSFVGMAGVVFSFACKYAQDESVKGAYAESIAITITLVLAGTVGTLTYLLS